MRLWGDNAKEQIEAKPAPLWPELTSLQEFIVLELNKGETVKKIAQRLKVSVSNIYMHLQRIEAKGFVLRPVKNKQRVIRIDVYKKHEALK